MTNSYDVVVVGGGAAGLGGAVTLARARRSVLVIDAGQPRNAPADGVHMFLGSEGSSPAALAAAGRAEAEAYGARFQHGEAVSAKQTDGGFEVSLADGSVVAARRLLLTTGLVDELPEIPGVAQRWGREVLHCPYCHGWEVRDQAIAILATGPQALHGALLWRQWSPRVTLLLHDQTLATDALEQLAAREVTVVEGLVRELEITDDKLVGVAMADGRSVACDALVVGTRLTARSAVAESLGIEPVTMEAFGTTIGTYLPVEGFGSTALPGVWAAGNLTNLMDQVIGSAAAGVKAGAGINADLVMEETRLAVEARRGAHAMSTHEPPKADAAFWDAMYSEKGQIWSGDANVILVREATGLPAGTALDLGSGEGGDAIWLASRGWQVTAVDISQVALDRAAGAARDAGVGDRIDWQRVDLYESFPAGTFDLVTASFFHSYEALPREEILRRAAAAVAPGGLLLVIGHSDHGPYGDHERHAHVHLPKPDEVLAALRLVPDEWEVLLADEHERHQIGPDGEDATRTDNVVKVRRRP